jgi:hypothetical protein
MSVHEELETDDGREMLGGKLSRFAVPSWGDEVGVVGLLQLYVLLAHLCGLYDHESEVPHTFVDSDSVMEDLLGGRSAQSVVLAVGVLLGKGGHAQEMAADGSHEGLVVQDEIVP